MSSSKEVMEQIWATMKKADGKNVVFKQADVDYLYYSGFVDEKRCTIEDWQKAFMPFSQDGKTFVMNQQQFASLAPFRYEGVVKEIFDPIKLRDGIWTKEQLRMLFERSIKPCSAISEEVFWKFIEGCQPKNDASEQDGFFLDKGVKVGLREFMEQFPSNRRRLEKTVRQVACKKIQRGQKT
ncbi:MAG TPA: hypothetical protein VJC18_04345 [bacterium]|nr:hypothetical protein [bacterium]